MKLLDLGYLVAAVVLSPVLFKKKRSGWRQRMGHVGPMLAEGPKPSRDDRGGDGRPRVLLHAVSVGEVASLRTLVPMLAEDAEVVVSVTTDTGLARARALYSDVASVVRYPLDFSWAVRRFLDHVRPDVVGLVELEVWPNFTKVCVERGIPVAVVGGRLSERSARGYRRFGFAVRPMFRRLSAVGARSGADADRFSMVGVPADRVRVLGSMKWDNAASGDEAALEAKAEEIAEVFGLDRSRPVVVGGSTGPGEEAMLHEACGALGDDVQLVCAPRRPERFDEAAEMMPGTVRRSTASGDPSATGRYVLDTIGELSAVYRLADVVVIGRSFFDLFGSDPIEPTGLGKATIIGPAVDDFREIVGVLSEAGGLVVSSRARIATDLERLIRDGSVRSGLGERGSAAVRAQRGASERTKAMLLELVG